MNGREYFKASIDTSQFDRDAAHIKSEFSRIGKTAEAEGARIDSSLRKIGTMAASVFSIQKATQFAKAIVNVRSEFQNTEAMFKVFLGSADKASAFMKEIQGYAFHNVFEFGDLTKQAAQLLAYGTSVEDTIPVIDRLSNVAAGVNVPLERLVELFNKAKSLGRLTSVDMQQWSVMGDVVGYLSDMYGKSNDEIREMVKNGKIGFNELNDLLINLTDNGGKFSGMMEEKMKTLGDSVGLLQDSFTSMMNEIGENTQEYLRGGILAINSLVENYQEIGKVIAHLIAVYGVYRAAVISLNAVQSLQSKIALESALAGTKLTTMQGLQAVSAKRLSAAQAALNKTMLANPYVLATMALVGLGYATYRVVTHKTKLQKATDDLEKSIFKERAAIDSLITRLNAANKDTDEYNQIKGELNRSYGDTLKSINLEVDALYRNKANYELLTKEIEKNTKAKLKNRYIEEFSEDSADKVAESYKKILDRVKKQVKGVDSGAIFGDIRDFIVESDLSTPGKAFDELFKKHGLRWADYARDVNSLLSSQYRLKKDLDELDLIFGDGFISKDDDSTGAERVMKSLAEQTKEARDAVAQLKQELADLRSGKTASENYAKAIEDKTKDLKDAEDRLSFLLTGKSHSDSGKTDSEAERLQKLKQEQANIDQRMKDNQIKSALDARSVELDNQQKMLDLMDEGFDKHERQIELNHQKEILNIQRRAQELIEVARQAEKDQWEKDGSKGVFIAKTQTTADLPDVMQSELIATDSIVLKAREKATDDLHKSLIEKYKDFAARRLDIEEHFDKELEKLNKLPESDERNRSIKQLEKDRKEAIKSINEEESAELVKTTDLFVRLFSDASRQSVAEIRKIIDETQLLYDYLSKTSSEDITDNFGFTAEQLRNFKGDAEQLKAILDGLIRKKDELGDKSPFQAFSQGLSDGLKDINKGGAENIGKGIEGIGTSVKAFLPTLSNFGEEMGAIFGDKTADDINTVTELLGGVADLGIGVGQIMSGDIVGGIINSVSGLSKIFSMGIDANKRHKKALDEIDKSRVSFQHQYNMLLREQNLLLKEASSIFGEKEISKTSNAIKEYGVAISDLKNSTRDLKNTQVVTGNKKKKIAWVTVSNKDIYSSILDIPEYKGIINKDGTLNIDMAQTILDTQKLTDKTRKYLEQLIELQQFADKAQEELRSYLQETFGSLGAGAIDSIVESIKTGTDAWLEFGDVGARVLERLGEQIAYELFFADKFKKLQNELESLYESGKTPEQIANDSMKLMSDFYSNIGNDLETAQSWMQSWKDEAKKQGFELWTDSKSAFSQSSSRGGFATATQDQIGELSGRFTDVQMKASSINIKLDDIHLLSSEQNLILKNHSIQFQEMRDIGLQSMYHLQDIAKYTKVLPATLPSMAKDIESISKKL